ncbi:MAG: aminopeptidase [Pseudohongiellaceae bacterium]
MKAVLVILVALFALSACETVSYYGQAVSGQLQILGQRRQIESLIADNRTDPGLKARLSRVLEIRQFAETGLGLPLEKTFSSYVELQRPYVVWNVFATPEFSMQPLQWCYPIAGCVSYRGYFREPAALRFAAGLADENHDTYVAGVAAYSTLGWFSDPVLSTVINREDYQLASLIFHELAHQLLYIPGDTAFNESFATALAQEGLKRWLEHCGLDTDASTAILERVQADYDRRQEFVSLVQETATELEQLYRSDKPAPEMRKAKQAVLDRLRSRYQQVKSAWGGYDGYDNWFSGDINNARINTVSTYFSLVPAFNALLAEEQGDLPAFYARVRQLQEMDKAQRQAFLAARLDQ